MNSVWRDAVILFISIAKMGFEQKGLPSPRPNPLSIKLMELLYLYFDLGNICRMVTLIFAFLTLYLTFNDGLITMRPTSDSGGGNQTQNSIQRDAKELL